MEATKRRIPRWEVPQVATAVLAGAQRYADNERVNIGPRTTSAARLSDSAVVIEMDNGQAFALIVEEMFLYDD